MYYVHKCSVQTWCTYHIYVYVCFYFWGNHNRTFYTSGITTITDLIYIKKIIFSCLQTLVKIWILENYEKTQKNGKSETNKSKLIHFVIYPARHNYKYRWINILVQCLYSSLLCFHIIILKVNLVYCHVPRRRPQRRARTPFSLGTGTW